MTVSDHLAAIDRTICRYAFELSPWFGAVGVDDLAQEGRIGAAIAFQRHTGKAPVRAVMLRRARFAMVDACRAMLGRHGQKQRVRDAAQLSIDALDRLMPSAPPDGHVALVELLDVAAVRLTPVERAIVSLRLAGLTMREVGDRLGLHESTICIKLKRMRERLTT